MTQSCRNPPPKQTILAKCQPSRWNLRSKLEHLWRINGEKASLLLPWFKKFSLFFFKKKGNQSRLQRLIERLLGTKRKCTCNVCVLNIIIWLARWAGNMNQILCCDWLPERARWSYLAPPGTSRRVTHGKFPWKPYNKSFSDQACLVKMAGYWHRSQKWGKTVDFVSCFPLHFFRALPLPACFTTEQSTVEASLFVNCSLCHGVTPCNLPRQHV